jgi:hypothetical protein
VKYQNMAAPEPTFVKFANRPPPGTFDISIAAAAAGHSNPTHSRKHSTRIPALERNTSQFSSSLPHTKEKNNHDEDTEVDVDDTSGMPKSGNEKDDEEVQIEKQQKEEMERLRKKFGIDQRGIDITRTQNMALEYCRSVHQRGGGFKAPRGK